MTDINEIRFSGTIEKLQPVTTRTGKPMARWLLRIGRDKFKCICFGNIAETVLQCQDGNRISLTGSGSISSWKDQEEHWHNDFQVTAWAVEIDGLKTTYEKQAGLSKLEPVASSRKPQQQGIPDQAPPPPDDRDPSQFNYSGGPF